MAKKPLFGGKQAAKFGSNNFGTTKQSSSDKSKINPKKPSNFGKGKKK